MNTPQTFKVVASYPLNFYAGTMNPAPSGYRRYLESSPMTMYEARSALMKWASAVESPAWQFKIVPSAH